MQGCTLLAKHQQVGKTQARFPPYDSPETQYSLYAKRVRGLVFSRSRRRTEPWVVLAEISRILDDSPARAYRLAMRHLPDD